MKQVLVCRSCGEQLRHSIVDLGMSPLANSFLSAKDLEVPETYYPLHLRICGRCFLAQLPQLEIPERIFSDYAYFSSYSDSWLEHCERFALTAIAEYRLGASSLIVEVGSNDGYLLQYFVREGIPVLGVEPAGNVGRVAESRGIRIFQRFFGREAAQEIVTRFGHADLVVGNNVLAHVPDLNDFVAGLEIVLKPGGVLTMEFPHLPRLIDDNQFDTIYHEHFSYFSFFSVEEVFVRHGLKVFRVEHLPTHGGSLRVHVASKANAAQPEHSSVAALRRLEREKGFNRIETYSQYGLRPLEVKHRLLAMLVEAKRLGQRVAAYGAAAKGNTLLNYCAIGRDLIDYVVDRSPHKQGRFLPGSRIPVHAPERLRETRPHLVLVLPWNLLDEVTTQLAYIRDWGGRFLVAIPEPRVIA